MKTQLRDGPVYGALPILYVFLARTGKTIHAVDFVNLDKNGDLHLSDEVPDADANNGASQQHLAAPGVRIVFSEADRPKQTLYYFSTNLADGSFERSGFSSFLAKLGPADSLIKSASYLLHKPHFAGIRKLLLNNSASIIQDDSGIPLVYFEATRWRLQAFGHYPGPIPMFASFYQPSMAELFRNANTLEFGIGYRWRKNESNLLFAQKGDEAVAQAQTDAGVTEQPTSAPKRTRRRVETPSLNCQFARVFPFC